jgi:hypothetical protein
MAASTVSQRWVMPPATEVTMKVLRMREFGKPTMAPELVESEAPEPAAGQVVVALEAAPINPSDLLLIRGCTAIAQPFRPRWAPKGLAGSSLPVLASTTLVSASA